MDRRPDRMTTAADPRAAPDADLLGRYAASRSPDAFAALVDRYLPLIYSAALRQTRDPHLAEDAAQATLLILAQKAGRVDPAMLPGWLVKTAHYAAHNAVRQRHRHAARERRAAAMRGESDAAGDSTDPDALSRLLDPALARLGDTDRTAVVLRYFQEKSFSDIAGHLRTTESAAQRRVARAVEKLRAILARQGVTAAPAALPAFLAAQSLHPVPPSLALKAISVSSPKIASTSLIAKGALHAMAVAKLKVPVAIAAAVLLVGVSAPTAYHYATARPEPAAAVPPPPLLPPGTDMSRPVSGSLPPGMTAEPLAVMRLADRRWITPTGGAPANLPAEATRLLPQIRVPGTTHAFLFRIVSMNDVSWSYSVQGVGSSGGTSSFDPDTLAQYCLIVFAPAPGATSLTLRVDVASGPWTNLCTIPASATAPVRGAVAGFPATLYPPIETGKRVRLRYDVPERPDQCVSCYALDQTGERVSIVGMSEDIKGNRFYEFIGALPSYKEFRVDARPYNYHATYAAVPLTQEK